MSFIQGEFQLVRKRCLNEKCYDFSIYSPELAMQSKAGQFLHIKVDNHMLRRPISICEIDRKNNTVRFVFEARGEGTKILSQYNDGDFIDILGPLGNSFEILDNEKSCIVVGGGIGIFPLLEVAKQYGSRSKAILGFRDKSAVVMEQDFKSITSETFISTDDGSYCHKGNVCGLLATSLKQVRPDIIYVCGPKPMLKAVAEIAIENGVRCQVSLEERMGCGIGACLVCACKVKGENEDEFDFKHVCKDGPIFEAQKVIF